MPYHEGLDFTFAEKVCVKSHLSTMSLSSASNLKQEEYIESVIPFLDEGYVAYSTYFFVNDHTARGRRRALGIVTLVDRSEQLSLYKSIPEISATIKDIASELIKIGDPKNNVPDAIKDRLNQLIHFTQLSVDFDVSNDSISLIKERMKEEKITLKESSTEFDTSTVTEGSFEFLLNRVPKGLDRVIFALLKNERVLVFGEKEEIAISLATLRWFLPHKKLYNDLWTVPLMDAEALFSRSSDSTTLHVLGIESDSFYEILQLDNNIPESSSSEFIDNEKYYNKKLPIDSKVIINLDGGRVIGGISNRFCNKLLETINVENFAKAPDIISEHIDYLIGRVNDLTSLFLNDPSKEELEQFISNSIEGEISLIMTIINETNTGLLEKIINVFSNYQLPLEVLF
ncbi:MAG: hypothetical protein HZR80_11750 [Candidatus Heimdallarchaeota archaeon]